MEQIQNLKELLMQMVLGLLNQMELELMNLNVMERLMLLVYS
jgi:hypothetical protein